MPIIIDNFSVNNANPIDNRCVVGTTSFYTNKDLIQYKYPGLRIWDLNDGTPYVWTGTTWLSENSVGVTVDNTTVTNYIPKFKGTTLLGNSIIYETGTGAGNVGIGLAPSAILPNISGVTTQINGLHVSGNIKTDNKFIGNGLYITDINASNITSGSLTINRISPLFNNGGSTNTSQVYVLQNTGNNIEWVLSSSISGGSSTNSDNVKITEDNTTDATHYINFTQGYTGYNILKASSSKLQFKPSTGTLLSTNVDLSGNIKVKDYLSIGSNTLSPNSGSEVSLVKLTTFTGNADYLDITNTRVSNLNSWTSAGYRIQQKVDFTYMAYIQFNGNNDGGISFGTGQTTTSATSISERFKIDQSGNSFFTENVQVGKNVQVGGNVSAVGNGTFGTGYISLTSLESGEMKLENVGTSPDGILKRLRSSWYNDNFDYNIYRGGSTNITKATFTHNNTSILTLEPGGIRVPNYAHIEANLLVGINSTIEQSALVNISSTNKGVLLPRMTSTQRNAISNPTRGLTIYNNDPNIIHSALGVHRSALNIYDGSKWTGVTPFLYRGRTNRFDNGSTDSAVRIWFTTAGPRYSSTQPSDLVDIGTTGYMVCGSLEVVGNNDTYDNYDRDNDVIFTIGQKFNNGFVLVMREFVGVLQYLRFSFYILPLSDQP